MNNKIAGILLLLIYVCAASALLSDGFVSPFNIQNIVRYTALYGIIGVGVSFVIITGGIDLSIGSLIGLTGCILPMLLVDRHWSAPAAMCAVMVISLLLGLAHGLLITKLNLQPFIVTLCGLLIYRGLARWITGDQVQGFGTLFDNSLRLLATGKPCSVAILILLAGLLAAPRYAWRLLTRSDNNETAPHQWELNLSGTIMGLVLAVVGSSRFWWGVAFEPGNWAATISDQAAGLPQVLMGWCGLGVVPAAAWLLMVVGRRKPGNIIFPLLVLMAAAFLAWWVARVVRQPDEWFWENGLSVKTQRMLLVFASLGLLMGAVGWFYKSALRVAGKEALAPLTLSGFFALLWLLGQTPLGQTLVPAPAIVLIVLASTAGVFLNQTIFGRYLLALGRNEEAARYSGINTDRMVILAYVLCAAAAGLGGMLYTLDSNAVQPASHGEHLELYAIAAAVLGGCSLRGGEGSILGVLIGAAIIRVLSNAINILGIPSQQEFAIIGGVILFGVLADELVKRFSAGKRLTSE